MFTNFVISLLTGSLFVFSSADTTHSVQTKSSNKPDQNNIFNGKYFSGEGDLEYLQMLDTAYRMYYPDPELQNISMLYAPAWNGFVEGPTWGAWWIQNSYGPSYCALPFLLEPYTTFLQNAQDLWFNQMGDGVQKGGNDWVAPDGCLCDAASPGWIYYKQGDGRTDIHDWGMEFTAAGVVLQTELLLISRDMEAIKHYLPMLERSANFIETRRDPNNNLFLAGPAGNLLAPSYAGWHKPDGSYDKAYLTGLSVSYIAGLDRLIELEKMVGNTDKVNMYTERRDLAKKGLPALMTDEGYFIKYMDPDGTKHGVYGAEKHGYFEATCNHDAIAFRVVDDIQAKKIYDKIASIPDLRRNDVIINNCPSLDDMYTQPEGLWAFGHWVNGGHWTTCEARMMLGYYRLGKYEDARRSMKHILKFAEIFRTDNPLINFGANVYQPNEPINCVYDTWGVPSAFIRGLFEYLYRADGLTLIPHIPDGIKKLRQNFPIRYGNKKLYLVTEGIGEVTSVCVNGEQWKSFDNKSVFLAYDKTPDVAEITICMGGASPQENYLPEQVSSNTVHPPDSKFWDISDFGSVGGDAVSEEAIPLSKVSVFYARLCDISFGKTYEAQHARLIIDYADAIHARAKLKLEGKFNILPTPSQFAADKSYVDAVNRLTQGLRIVMESYNQSDDPYKKRLYTIWQESIKE